MVLNYQKVYLWHLISQLQEPRRNLSQEIQVCSYHQPDQYLPLNILLNVCIDFEIEALFIERYLAYIDFFSNYLILEFSSSFLKFVHSFMTHYHDHLEALFEGHQNVNPGGRKSKYCSDEEKKMVAEYARRHGPSAAARKFNIPAPVAAYYHRKEYKQNKIPGYFFTFSWFENI